MVLIITRTKGKSIMIYPEDISEDVTVAELFADGPIEISVVETRSHQCKLGITAPSELVILREEIYQG
jgi:carbon storage regulator CsrA